MRTGKLATEGTNLIINSLTTDDVGTYTCTVAWAGQSVTHVLEVTGELMHVSIISSHSIRICSSPVHTFPVIAYVRHSYTP